MPTWRPRPRWACWSAPTPRPAAFRFRPATTRPNTTDSNCSRPKGASFPPPPAGACSIAIKTTRLRRRRGPSWRRQHASTIPRRITSSGSRRWSTCRRSAAGVFGCCSMPITAPAACWACACLRNSAAGIVLLGGLPDGRFEHTPEPTAENLADVQYQVAQAGAGHRILPGSGCRPAGRHRRAWPLSGRRGDAGAVRRPSCSAGSRARS